LTRTKLEAVSIKSICLFSGQAHLKLSEEIATRLGTRLAGARVSRFSDAEMFCRIEENVRGLDTFIIQPTCAPVNDTLMELLIMCDALRRASAGSITAVLPYYGYARQDRKVAPRTPITAKLVADLLEVAGVSRAVCVDLHAGQIQGFFRFPTDNLYALPVFLDYLKDNFNEDAVFVSPDAGGVERARAYSKQIGGSLAIVDKRRERANVSEVMHIIGDVKDRDCVIVDDMIDTAGTLCNAAQAVKDAGARSVVACATHGVLSGPAVERIATSVLDLVVVTNTIPPSPQVERCEKIHQISVAPLLAEAIRRIDSKDSLSSLFV
jgi:ribose-phosphate pyrophosphokinase